MIVPKLSMLYPVSQKLHHGSFLFLHRRSFLLQFIRVWVALFVTQGVVKRKTAIFMEADPLLLPVGTRNEPINALFFHFITQHLLNAYSLLGLSYPIEM